MPWNKIYYPSAMAHLPEAVRNKTISIANTLLREGMDEGQAIRVAIAKARRWAAERSRSNPFCGRMSRV